MSDIIFDDPKKWLLELLYDANKADYEINRVYNLSGMEKLLKDKNDKGFFLDSKTNKKGVTSYDYPYAIWTGDRFVPIQPLPNQN